MTVCGFEYDATFLEWAGTRLYAGVELAEYELARSAAASGVTVGELRKRLRARYRARMAEVLEMNGGEASEGAGTR
jgi:hypothetical protein